MKKKSEASAQIRRALDYQDEQKRQQLLNPVLHSDTRQQPQSSGGWPGNNVLSFTERGTLVSDKEEVRATIGSPDALQHLLNKFNDKLTKLHDWKFAGNPFGSTAPHGIGRTGPQLLTIDDMKEALSGIAGPTPTPSAPTVDFSALNKPYVFKLDIREIMGICKKRKDVYIPRADIQYQYNILSKVMEVISTAQGWAGNSPEFYTAHMDKGERMDFYYQIQTKIKELKERCDEPEWTQVRQEKYRLADDFDPDGFSTISENTFGHNMRRETYRSPDNSKADMHINMLTNAHMAGFDAEGPSLMESKQVSGLKGQLASLRLGREQMMMNLSVYENLFSLDYDNPDTINKLPQRQQEQVRKVMSSLDDFNDSIKIHEDKLGAITATRDSFKSHLQNPSTDEPDKEVKSKEILFAIKPINKSNLEQKWKLLMDYGKSRRFSHRNYKEIFAMAIEDEDVNKTFDRNKHKPLKELLQALADRYVERKTVQYWQALERSFMRLPGETLRLTLARFRELLEESKDAYTPEERKSRAAMKKEELLLRIVDKDLAARLNALKIKAVKDGANIRLTELVKLAEEHEEAGPAYGMNPFSNMGISKLQASGYNEPPEPHLQPHQEQQTQGQQALGGIFETMAKTIVNALIPTIKSYSGQGRENAQPYSGPPRNRGQRHRGGTQQQLQQHQQPQAPMFRQQQQQNFQLQQEHQGLQHQPKMAIQHQPAPLAIGWQGQTQQGSAQPPAQWHQPLPSNPDNAGGRQGPRPGFRISQKQGVEKMDIDEDTLTLLLRQGGFRNPRQLANNYVTEVADKNYNHVFGFKPRQVTRFLANLGVKEGINVSNNNGRPLYGPAQAPAFMSGNTGNFYQFINHFLGTAAHHGALEAAVRTRQQGGNQQWQQQQQQPPQYAQQRSNEVGGRQGQTCWKCGKSESHDFRSCKGMLHGNLN